MLKWLLVLTAVIWILAAYSLFLKNFLKKKKDLYKKLSLFNKIYVSLIRMPFIRTELLTIKKNLYDNNLYEEYYLRYKTVADYIISWVCFMISFSFIIIYFKDNIYILLPLIMFAYSLKVMVLNFLIGDDTKLLKGLIDLVKDLQQNFELYKDVELALQESINESTNYLVVSHMTKISEILNEEGIENFTNECGNEFLQLLSQCLYMTKEFGDKLDNDGKSVFVENLSFINENIESELYKRTELKYWLKWLSVTVMIPLLAFTPYDKWISETLPITDMFYKSSIGFLDKLSIILITVVIFFILRSLEASKDKILNVKRVFWEDKVLKIKLLDKLVRFISPKRGSKKYYYYLDLIAKSGINTKIEWIFLKKIICSVATFAILLPLAVTLHNENYRNILRNNSSIFTKSYIVMDNNQVDSTNLETEIIKQVKPHIKTETKEELKSNIEGYLKEKGLDDNSIKILTDKIVNKIDALDSETLKWYEWLIMLALTFVASEIPIIIMLFNSSLKKYDMQREIILFETVVLILMHYENCTTEMILEYMAKISRVFKNPIEKAVLNLQKGNAKALNDLIDEVNYKPFTNIIKNLIRADDIKLKVAFSNLSSSRKTYSRNREEENKKIIYKRVSLGRGISMIPVVLIVVCYIGLPFMWISQQQMNEFSTSLQQSINK